jgi:hypothetical protein
MIMKPSRFGARWGPFRRPLGPGSAPLGPGVGE